MWVFKKYLEIQEVSRVCKNGSFQDVLEIQEVSRVCKNGSFQDVKEIQEVSRVCKNGSFQDVKEIQEVSRVCKIGVFKMSRRFKKSQEFVKMGVFKMYWGIQYVSGVCLWDIEWQVVHFVDKSSMITRSSYEYWKFSLEVHINYVKIFSLHYHTFPLHKYSSTL